ncbi:BREX-2 system phosphatase PglZ [Streptosporangium sp. NPDC004631]
MREGRWTTITPSQYHYRHEREALEHIRAALPETEPYRAWSNFTFTADSGHVREVDLFVAAPGGLFLIEIKSLHGWLSADGAHWVQSTDRNTRYLDDPLPLADSKAGQLTSLLRRTAGHPAKIPPIRAAVLLPVPSLEVDLPEHRLTGIFGPENGRLPKILSDLLLVAPDDQRHRITPEVSRQLDGRLRGAGMAKSRSHLWVGAWELEPRPLDTGPTWEDHLATHGEIESEKRRVRVYLVERDADERVRADTVRAARREMLALRGIGHPGIVRVDTMEQHATGPALIFRHDPEAVRLDHFVGEYGARLDLPTRLGLIRQLAEAVSYAHGRHLHHRALSARSVLVTPGTAPGGAEERGRLNPLLQIGDWQAATRADGGTEERTSPADHAVPHLAVHHLELSAQAYFAPELNAPDPDPVALDVFGLGALSYLLLTGRPPADRRTELLARLSREDGLRPSTADDSMTEFMDELVQAATVPEPARRLTGVAEFLEMLEAVEAEATATRPVHPARSGDERPEEGLDPLDARPGDVVGGEWRVDRRLGTGSTSRALLVENLRTGRSEVLRVALSEERTIRLDHEASVLRDLRDGSPVVSLVRPEPIRVGGRTCVVLERAGERTVAREIRERGALPPDELETYGDHLFGAMDFLEREGVTHRDVRPGNIAIRVRPDRARRLVLFDFSLAGTPVREIWTGTPHYLDPFLGTAGRTVYDAHAERYALAVTLHEMASGKLPVWGDGTTEPRHTEGPPTLAAEAFDPAVRDGLIEFFPRALHRDAGQRFETLRDMRDAWIQVFRRSGAVPPVSAGYPGGLPAEDATATEARDAAALAATRVTVPAAAGLSSRAVSAAHRLDAATVGDLLNLPSTALLSLPGLGAGTRRELQHRVRDWRTRLNRGEPITSDEKAAAHEEVASAIQGRDEETALGRIGLDTIAALLVPDPHSNGRNAGDVEATRLLLGLPDADGTLPEPWPQQPVVASAIGMTPGRVAQMLTRQRRRWSAERVIHSVRDELLELLVQSGRVMTAAEAAEAILASRGSHRADPRLRLAFALAAVRAAVEIDPLVEEPKEPRLLLRRHGDRLLMALEVGADDSPGTTPAPALLDYADALGEAADRLAAQEVLPAPATVLRELRAVGVPGQVPSLEDGRLVRLAAAASRRAAATSRLEIYPGDLDPVLALRLTQAGAIPPGGDDGRPEGLRPERIHERVRARFPALAPLPGHPHLDLLLREAGFDVRWREGRYVRPQPPDTVPGTGAGTESGTVSRLFAAKLWRLVEEGFGVQRTDPRLVAEGWAAEALIDAMPPGGWPRPAGAVLTRETALRRLAARRLRLDRLGVDAEEPNAATLLLWSSDAVAVEAFRGLRATERAGLSAWLRETAGSLAEILFHLVDGGHAGDALALGLVCGALWNPLAEQVAWRARGDVLTYLSTMSAGTAYTDTAYTGASYADTFSAGGSHLSAREAGVRGFASTAEGVVTRLLHEGSSARETRLAHSVLDRAEELVVRFGARPAARHSDLLRSGFEDRIDDVASALASALKERSPERPTASAESVARLRAHTLAGAEAHRVRRAEMAQRLLQWLVRPYDPAEHAGGGVGAAVQAQIDEWGWVDRAREDVWLGEPYNSSLKDAYKWLHDLACDRGHELNRAFAAELSAWTATGPGDLLTVDTLLPRVVAPLVADGSDLRCPLLLVVLNGMSAAAAVELAEDLREQRWEEYDPLPGAGEQARRRAAMAAIPTLTGVSRASLFAARLTTGGAAEEREAFENHPFWEGRTVRLFHEDGLRGAGESLGDELTTALQDASVHVGVVLNTIDDTLDKGSGRIDEVWGGADLGVLRSLLDHARRGGRAVILTSDHGHVLERGGTPRPLPCARSARHRDAGGPVYDGEVELTGPRVAGGRLIALWDPSLHYLSGKAGYHGGVSLAEVTIPLLAFLPHGSSVPAGWRALPDQRPEWWSLEPGSPRTGPSQTGPLAARTSADPDATLVADLLATELFAAQHQMMPRRVPKARIQAVLLALLRAGGTLPLPVVAQSAGEHAVRGPGFVATLRRILNVDSHPVLSITDSGRSARLDVHLLKEQFGLGVPRGPKG